jgi:hypothetical protein
MSAVIEFSVPVAATGDCRIALAYSRHLARPSIPLRAGERTDASPLLAPRGIPAG